MLISMHELLGYTLSAQDGEIGRCSDLLFDDERWTTRYMVADTRRWLPGRKVLISPIAITQPDWDKKSIPVRLTREQIRQSPPLDEDAPISRRYEMKWFEYYGWPYYWTAGGLWGAAPYPTALYLKRLEKVLEKDAVLETDCRLRSFKEVRGYDVLGLGGSVGTVTDFIMENEDWSLRYLVADVKDTKGARKVRIGIESLKSITWAGMAVTVEAGENQSSS